MKKVIFLKSRVSSIGGLEKTSRQLIAAFLQRGAKVTLLTTEGDAPLKECEVVPVCAPSKHSLLHHMRYDRACQKWLQNKSYDVVFGMERTSFQTHFRAGNGVHAAYLKNRMQFDPFLKKLSPFFNPLHPYLLHLEKKQFEHPLLQKVFVNSPMVEKEVLDHFSIPKEKVEMVFNGVELKEWEKPFERSLEKERDGPYKLLFVGNGYFRKGLHYLLSALRRVPQELFHLTIIGRESRLSHFQRLAQGLPCTFLGEKKSLIPYYAEADCLVLPSLYDPCANVTLEALAMGLYVLTTPFNGAAFAIGPGCGALIGHLESMEKELLKALQVPKNRDSAIKIRNSISSLDFSEQLFKIVDQCLISSIL